MNDLNVLVNGITLQHTSRVCKPDTIDPSLCQADSGGPALYADGFRESLAYVPAVRFSLVRCDDANDAGATPCVDRGAGVAVTLDEVVLHRRPRCTRHPSAQIAFESVILAGTDYILGTRTARMAARAPPTTANVNLRGHGTTSKSAT